METMNIEHSSSHSSKTGFGQYFCAPIRSPDTGEPVRYCGTQIIARWCQIAAAAATITGVVVGIVLGIRPPNSNMPPPPQPLPPSPGASNYVLLQPPNTNDYVPPQSPEANNMPPSPQGGPVSSSVWCAIQKQGEIYLCEQNAVESTCFTSMDSNSAIDFSTDSIYSRKYSSQIDCLSSLTCTPHGLNLDVSTYVYVSLSGCTFGTCTIDGKQLSCASIDISHANLNCNTEDTTHLFNNCQECIDYIGCNTSEFTSYCHPKCT